MKKQNNAKLFIDAYNQIDYALRAQHNFKRSMSFSDMIRRAVGENQIVRKYEDILIDYGRLRNAIIHNGNDEYIIAEPHDDVVKNITKIAKLISTPPKALDTVCTKDVLSVNFDVSIKKVIELITDSRYSNLPVYKNGRLIGVANGQKILDALGNILLENKSVDEFIEKTSIESIMPEQANSMFYEIASATSTIEEILDMFQNNRKLLVVIITKTGTLNEAPLGIITATDVMEMNNILDNYY